jgi:ubiquinone/menaquinone biosynthesis methyltransferase
MFARIAPGYDKANLWMSLGIDRLWRRKILKLAGAKAQGDVLDLCAGTLDFSLMLQGTASSLTAVDFCQEMLDVGAKRLPVDHQVRLICADARVLPLPEQSMDLVVAGFGIRNVPEPDRAVAEIFRVLKPGGVFLIVDFFRPESFIARLMAGSYNRIMLPLVGGLITGDASAYRYLADSMGAWVSRPGFEAICAQKGFNPVQGAELFPPVASWVQANKPEATP